MTTGTSKRKVLCVKGKVKVLTRSRKLEKERCPVLGNWVS